MADEDKIRETVKRYVATFSAGDRDGWLALWADDATMEDPVGTPVKHGKEEIGAFYDTSRASAEVELRLSGPAIVCGREASFSMEVRPTIGTDRFVMPVIDVMSFDDDGRITSQRAFVDFSLLKPA